MLTATQLGDQTAQSRRAQLESLAGTVYGTEQGARTQLCKDLGVTPRTWDRWMAGAEIPAWPVLLLSAWVDLREAEEARRNLAGLRDWLND